MIRVEDLKVGDVLVLANGNEVDVRSVSAHDVRGKTRYSLAIGSMVLTNLRGHDPVNAERKEQ